MSRLSFPGNFLNRVLSIASCVSLSLLLGCSRTTGSGRVTSPPDLPPGQGPDAARAAPKTPKPRAAPTRGLSNVDRGWGNVRRALEGMGGADAVDSVRSIEMRGHSVRREGEGLAADWKITTRILFPDHYRQDIQILTSHVSIIVTPRDAFLLLQTDNSVPAVTPLPPEQRRDTDLAVLRSPLALLKTRSDPTFDAIFASEEDVGGAVVDDVDVLAGGESTRISIDRATGRITRIRYQRPSPDGQPSREMEVRYDDFRPVGGLVYPFRSNGLEQGKPVFTTTLESIDINEPLEPSLFRPPGGTAETPKGR